MRTILLFALCTLVAGCTILPEREALDLFTLPSPSLSRTDNTNPIPGGLRLSRPETSDALGSNRILVTTDGVSFQAHSGARWAAAVPVLWRDWMLDAFWRDGRFSALSISSDNLRAERELGGMLRALHIEYENGRGQAVIRFDALLVDTADRSIIASQRFEARQATGGDEAMDGVRALGAAADRLALELIDWAAEHARLQPQYSR